MTWEIVKNHHPTAWEPSTTYRIFYKGDIGNNGLGNQELHIPYSSDLAFSDLHLLGPMQVHLESQKFQRDKLKCSVQNWLYIQDETFYAAGICTLPGKYKKYISVKEVYL